MTTWTKLINLTDRLDGPSVSLRLLTLDDCTPAYEGWLADPQVNRYLETRWSPQTSKMIRAFVAAMLASPTDYLFAIERRADHWHIGNLKIGPIHLRHHYADISYFIGERAEWGKGRATEAIALATDFAFRRLSLDRLQAGLYAGNQGSARALERVGFRLEGVFRQQLQNDQGIREDCLLYGLLRSEWSGPSWRGLVSDMG